MKILFYEVLAAAFFCWPLITRKVSIGAIWTMFWVAIGTIVVSVLNLALRYGAANPAPDTRVAMVGLLAGFSCGLGFWFYTEALCVKGVNVATVVTVVTCLVPVLALIGGRIFYGDDIGPQKLVGMAVILIGIYLVR